MTKQEGNDTLKDGREPGFFIVDNEVVVHYGPTIGVYGIAVYNALAYFANKNGGSIFPSYQTIAEMLDISRPKVISTIKVLIQVGLISKERRTKETGDQTSNEYTLENVKGGKQHLPPSKPHLPPSKQHLLPVVNDINYPSKQRLPDQDPLIKTHLINAENATPTGALDWLLPTPSPTVQAKEDPKPEPAPVLSMVEQWRKLHDELQAASNKPAKLMEIYQFCFGPHDLPNFGRLGALGKKVGYGLLAEQMWKCVPKPPSGDKLAYLQTINKNNVKQAEIDQKAAEASPMLHMQVL